MALSDRILVAKARLLHVAQIASYTLFRLVLFDDIRRTLSVHLPTCDPCIVMHCLLAMLSFAYRTLAFADNVEHTTPKPTHLMI